jgi:hypothetical protein
MEREKGGIYYGWYLTNPEGNRAILSSEYFEV